MPGSVNLDFTGNCPTVAICRGCGGTTDLAVATFGAQVGVYCATVCGTCVAQKRVGSINVHEAFELVAEHCGHLGIDLDQMARIFEAEA